jgi:DNA-binding CsgD family transcriptional regulator
VGGRSEIDAAVRALLERVGRGGGGALVIEGEPGIGKTTVLRTLAAAAEERGCTVWRITGIEAEIPLIGAALTGTSLEHLATIPGEVAAYRAALAAAIGVAPLVVMIDDAHWLDSHTADLMAFAARRVADDAVGFVVAVRTGHGSAFDDLPRHVLGPIDLDAATAILRRTGSTSDAVVRRCRELTNGNPMALAELADVLTPPQHAGRSPLPEAVPLSDRLARSFASRIADLSVETTETILDLAIGGALVTTAQDLTLLAPAEQKGLIHLDGAPRFHHPLVRAAVAARASPDELRRSHARLAHRAQARGDQRRSTWHRARSISGIDNDTAGELIALAHGDLARGRPEFAAAAAELAASIADGPRIGDYWCLAAHAHHAAGSIDAALRAVDRVLDHDPTVRNRLQALAVRGLIASWSRNAPDAVRSMVADATEFQADAPDVAVGMSISAAMTSVLAGDLVGSVIAAERAVAIAQTHLGGTPLEEAAAIVRGCATFSFFDGQLTADQQAALDFARTPPATLDNDVLALLAPTAWITALLERFDDASLTLVSLVSEARRRGITVMQGLASAYLCEVEFRAGRWTHSLAAAELDVVVREDRASLPAAFGHATGARVRAHLGDLDGARSWAVQSIDAGVQLGMAGLTLYGQAALGAAALHDSDPHRALHHLDVVQRTHHASQAAIPGIAWHELDLIAALMGTGERSRVRSLVEQVSQQHARLPARWSTLVVAVGRALIGDGSVDGAAEAIRQIERCAPFEAARAEVMLAEAGRATGSLDRAMETFDRLGAIPWQLRVRPLLQTKRSTTGSRRSESFRPALSAQLSAAELRVALAVARGLLTNEIAGELTLSPRTVEAHLRSIFRKLNVRNRAGVAALVAASTGQGPDR